MQDVRAAHPQSQDLPAPLSSPAAVERRASDARVIDGPADARPPAVRADEPIAEAGRRGLRFHFLHMVANEEGARAGTDVEALHDMRVATRRQRAIFRIVGPHFTPDAIAGFRDALRTLARRLGAVRDLDVLLGGAAAYQKSPSGGSEGSLDALMAEWHGRRAVVRADLLAYLGGAEYQEFRARSMVFLASVGAGVAAEDGAGTPRPRLVRDVLPGQLWEHYGRMRAYETDFTQASAATIHGLRIAAKRLRYLLEFSRGALGRGRRRLVETVVALQDHAGAFHDANVAIGRIEEFLGREGEHLDPDPRARIRRYLEFECDRRSRLQRTLDRPWEKVVRKRFRTSLGRAAARL